MAVVEYNGTSDIRRISEDLLSYYGFNVPGGIVWDKANNYQVEVLDPVLVAWLIARDGFDAAGIESFVDAISGIGGNGSPLQNLHLQQRSTSYKMADHTCQAMERGVFTPLSETALVEVSYSGLIGGVGHISTFLAWNQNVAPGTDLMTGKGFEFGPFIPDTQHVTIGPSAGPGNTGQTKRKVKLTGLTVGEPVTWEVIVGATGYYEEFTVNIPVDVALAQWQGNWRMLVSEYGANKVSVWEPGNRWEVGGITRKLYDIPSQMGAYGLAVHPSTPNIVFIGRYTSNDIAEYNLATESIVRTISLPSKPLLMTIANDGKLYVGVESGAYYGITLHNGTLGNPIGVGAGGISQKPKAIGPHVYVPCPTANRIDRIATFNNAVSSLAMGSSSTPVAVSANPADPDRMWVLERVPARAREIDVSDFAFTGENTVTAMAGTPNDFGVSPSGRSLVQVSHTRLLQTFVIPGKGTFYEGGNGNGSRIVIDTYGDLWILEQTLNKLKHFHCGILEVDPTNEFWGGYSDFMAQPVLAFS